jgi:hypothetical protein
MAEWWAVEMAAARAGSMAAVMVGLKAVWKVECWADSTAAEMAGSSAA